MDEVRQSFNRAREAIGRNPIAVWFPMLFAATAWIFYILLLLVLITPAVPDLLTMDPLLASEAMIENAGGRMVLLFVLGVLVYAVHSAGLLGISAAAVRGGELGADAFFNGVRRLLPRIFVQQGLQLLLYGVFIAALAAVVFLGPWASGFLSPEAGEPLAALFPLVVVGALLVAGLSIIFALWPLAIALDDSSFLESLKRGVRLAWQGKRQVAFIMAAGWSANLLSRMLLEVSSVGQLLHLVLSFVIRSYVIITLMYYYRFRRPGEKGAQDS